MPNYLDNLDIIDASNKTTNVLIQDRETLALAHTNATNIGALEELNTEDKSNLVNAVNEVKNEADANHTDIVLVDNKIGDLANLKTIFKDDIVGAINELTINDLIINVKEHGLVGDGVTNEGVAFQTLLNEYPNRCYYFPFGKYIFTGNTFSGNINLLGSDDATLVDFTFEDVTMPTINAENRYSQNSPFLNVNHLNFESTSLNFGLTCHVQSQGSVLRTFQISNCAFYGRRGLRLQNAITGNVESCDFIQNEYGIKSESSTNININNCNFYSPIYGVHISNSSDDTANRKGGESLHFNNCMWIDGVWGIYALQHNYLELSECMIDYMNMGVYLRGSKYARLINTWIGYDIKDRSSMPYYIAPSWKGCLAAYYLDPNYTSTVEALNCEFYGYGSANFPCVMLNGQTLQGGVEDSEFNNCRFATGSAGTMQMLFYASKTNDIRLESNNFYAPRNDALEWPYQIDDSIRTSINRNSYINCFKSNGTTIYPQKADNLANNLYNYEKQTVVVTASGSSASATQNVTFINTYESKPCVCATIGAGNLDSDYYKIITSIAAVDGNGCVLNLYKSDGNNLTGSYEVDLIIMANDE